MELRGASGEGGLGVTFEATPDLYWPSFDGLARLTGVTLFCVVFSLALWIDGVNSDVGKAGDVTGRYRYQILLQDAPRTEAHGHVFR